MPDLIAKPALGHPPLTLAGTTLAEADWTPIHSIAAFPGREKALDQSLGTLGLGFPLPNRWVQQTLPDNKASDETGARMVWAGRDQAFLFGAVPPADLPAAVTDQSDGWVILTLTGPEARAVLFRLVPLDLRHLGPGDCARSALNHMPLLLIVEAADRFRLLTFRSMARTAWHELHEALVRIAARRDIA